MEVVTKQADKNLGLVPIRGDYYAAMLRAWLKEPDFIRVDSFPHDDIIRRISNTIRYTQSIGPTAKKKWIEEAESAKEPCPFYAIPKIHKANPLASRPISAQHSYVLAPLSKALTTVLLQAQQRYVGITRDTVSFVNRIENFTTTHPFVLLTYDVEACYPSIDLKDAIGTLHRNLPVMREQNGFWTKILQLIMFNNYVKANGKIYRQMIGTATGTQVAPPFANLYLFFKFKKVLENPQILLSERFIDDGFVLVSSRSDAERVVIQLNAASNLRLTHDISDKEAIFLDLVIYKGIRYQNERRLDLRTYFKPTNRLLYLPMVSNHPRTMKAGIITGEAIRTLRNSSDKLEWLKALEFIFKGLRARGYPASIIQRAWKNVRWEQREMYVTGRSTKNSPPGTLVFTRYHPGTRPNWSSLLAKHPFENIFPKRRLVHNLRQLNVMKSWPPTIVWSTFRKVGHNVISAKESWSYPNKRSKRTREEEEQENLSRKKRRPEARSSLLER